MTFEDKVIDIYFAVRVLSMVPHFVRFFALFRCVLGISPRFASQFSKIVYRRTLATSNFRQWFRLLSEI